MCTSQFATLRRKRLQAEIGRWSREAPNRVALLYPSPYHVGMSSLGFLSMYRELNTRPATCCERAFLPDAMPAGSLRGEPLRTYESGRLVADFPLLAISVAYELELAGLAQVLALAGVPPLARERNERHPFVLCGGPITFSNPLPLAPFADAVLLGEADETVHQALDILAESKDRAQALRLLSDRIPSCYVPAHHGETLTSIARADNSCLPAYSPLRTPHTELSNMFLLEAERGCSRGCTYCVMRRSTNGGMRLVPADVVLSTVPKDAQRVGLVGAAVSDHPKIVDIVRSLADQGKEVGLSSLRPDRLSEPFVAALRKAGYRTLTTAADAASQRLRDSIARRAREPMLLAAAELARRHGYERIKLYMMLGLPDEQDEDIDELIDFSLRMASIQPLALAIAPFVSKRNTPLDGQPFAGIRTVDRSLSRLRRGLKGKVELRSTSSRWAWVEYVLAQGGAAEGEAVLGAVRAGGRFQHYKRAFEALPTDRARRALRIVS